MLSSSFLRLFHGNRCPQSCPPSPWSSCICLLSKAWFLLLLRKSSSRFIICLRFLPTLSTLTYCSHLFLSLAPCKNSMPSGLLFTALLALVVISASHTTSSSRNVFLLRLSRWLPTLVLPPRTILPVSFLAFLPPLSPQTWAFLRMQAILNLQLSLSLSLCW